MEFMNSSKKKTVQISDEKAVALIESRAKEERRSLASSGAVTIIECLSKKYDKTFATEKVS
jgi:hypothetical protein